MSLDRRMVLAALLGILFGWLGSVPVAGPISALVITRGIQGRFKAGVFIALGGGLVEALYAFLAFWGFSTYLTAYPIFVPIARGGAAVVLLVLGLTFVLKKNEEGVPDSEIPPRDSRRASFLLGAWICAINPALIATWTAVITALYSSDAINFTSDMAVPFALGCAVGIFGWFLFLLIMIRRYRERFSHDKLRKVVRVIGFVLLLVAIWFGYRFVDYFVHPPAMS